LLFVAVLPLFGRLVPTGLAILVLGLSLALIVGGFFAWVEGLLKNSTKSDIAGWLVGVEVGKRVGPWPETLRAIFDKTFGPKHLSWKCFSRSFLFSSSIFTLVLLFGWMHGGWLPDDSSYKTSPHISWQIALLKNVIVASAIATVFITNIIPDYFATLKARFLIGSYAGSTRVWVVAAVLAGDLIVSSGVGLVCEKIASYSHGRAFWIIMTKTSLPRYLAEPPQRSSKDPFDDTLGDDSISNSEPFNYWLSAAFYSGVFLAHAGRPLYFLPAFATSMWIWLYAGSGLLLILARRIDIGFQWFNRKFDIEKKPLSAIGLVAGASVAVLYWTTMIVGGFMRT